MNERLLLPVRGMREFGPGEAWVRRILLRTIEDTLSDYDPVELPRLEHLELLKAQITTDSGESAAVAGDNQKMIFPVLKRGAKYDAAIKAIKEGDQDVSLGNEGLIFDQTLPLIRYHTHKHGKGRADVPNEFKYCQTGDVWRAERPQRGRYRQFKQVDIDIIYTGHNTSAFECITEQIRKVCDAISILPPSENSGGIYWNNTELVNRRFEKAEVPKNRYLTVAGVLDKYHKLGKEEITHELMNIGIADPGVAILLNSPENTKRDKVIEEFGWGSGSPKRMDYYIKHISNYDPFLLRGMNYYKGWMFELRGGKTGVALGGGGCYDGLAKRLFDAEWGGIGFSFGFERIYNYFSALYFCQSTLG